MASGKNLNVEHDDLKSLEDALEGMKGHLNQQIQTLYQVVDQVSASWSGLAATEYRNLQHQVNEDAKQINGILELVKEMITSAKGHFSQMDQEHQEALKRLQGGSGDNSILARLG